MLTPLFGATKTPMILGEQFRICLHSSTFELIYNPSDLHTFIHYNGKKYNPDLLLVISNLSPFTFRKVLNDPDSGHQQVLAEITTPSLGKSPNILKTSWNFKKVDWRGLKKLADSVLDPKGIDFSRKVDSIVKTISSKIIVCAKKCILRGKSLCVKCFWCDELAFLIKKKLSLNKKKIVL